VKRSQIQRAQDEQVQRAFEEFDCGFRH
jgi:hypothetical protein